MDKKKCSSCGTAPHECSCKNKEFTKTVVEINNPEQITLMRRVVIPASMGDDTAVPPAVGKYHNVLLFYESNSKSYLYSSDGIPTLLANGLTDYEQAVNLPEINGHTLLGDKTGDELGLQNKIPDIEQYARFFDTVADMKASTDLEDGTYARTGGYYNVNDGGSALYKIRVLSDSDTIDERFIISLNAENVVAELITDGLVNICQVGGQQNFAAVCNALLNDSKSIYVPKRNFNSESTIFITHNNTEFICDGDITFTGNNSVFMVIASEFDKIDFNGTITCGNNNVFLKLGSNTARLNNVDLYINRVSSCKIGLWLNPNNTHGVQFLRCHFNRIYSSEKGIFFNPGDTGANWINACTFIGGALHGPYGIVTRKGQNQVDPFNDNSFERIAFTSNSITLPLDIQFMINSWFDKMRMSENITGDYYVKLDNCASIRIENEAKMWLRNISVTNMPEYRSRIIIKAPFIYDNGGNRISNQIEFSGGTPYVNSDELWHIGTNTMYAYSDTSPDFSVPEYYFDGILATIGAPSGNITMTYTLPDIFRYQIKRFYLQLKYKNGTSSLTLNTPDNETIISFPTGDAAMSEELYLCERSGKTNGTLPAVPEWKVTKVNLEQ